MAIYSSVPPPDQQTQSAPPPQTQAPTTTLPIRGTNITLSIPLDTAEPEKENETEKKRKPRKEPLRRDSLKRRDALLKGKEGSRRRQRWENDTFLHVPNAQPPLPSDWSPGPTYPVHNIPYYLAPLWDLRPPTNPNPNPSTETQTDKDKQKGRIPPDLKSKLKRSKGAKTLLQELETRVRVFVREYEDSCVNGNGEAEEGEEGIEMVDSEDEEIVFVGRNGAMSDQARERERVLEREKMVWDAELAERGGGFGRWLVHSIAAYYGLSSRSVTVGDPARREAYVGIKGSMDDGGLPRPLWGLV